MFGGFIKGNQVINPDTGAKIGVCGSVFANILTTGTWFFDCSEQKFTKDIKWKIEPKKTIKNSTIKTLSPNFFRELMDKPILYNIIENEFIEKPPIEIKPEPINADILSEFDIINIKTTKNVTKICHMADIHIPSELFVKRLDEYKNVFETLYDNLRKQDIDLIIIAGDLVHVKLSIQPETLVLTKDFIINLSKIAPVIIIVGNHDFAENNIQRMDSVYAICYGIENVFVLKDTGAYKFNNIVFGYSSLYDKKIILAKDIKSKISPDNIIALFHGTVRGSVNCNNKLNISDGLQINAFNGYDIAMLGHIHKYQELHIDSTPVVYPGSLIQQNFGEDVKNHGYIIWDLKAKTNTFYELPNKYVHINMKIAHNEIIDYGNINDYMDRNIYLRIKSFDTNPHLIEEHIKTLHEKYKIVSCIHNLDDSCTNIKSTEASDDIIKIDDTNMHIEIENDMFNNDAELIKLNMEMKSAAEKICTKYEYSYWYPISLKFKNLFIYGNDYENNINFVSGINDICSPNMTGKSSIVNVLMWCLYGQISYGTSKSVDIVNKNHTEGMAELMFKCDNKTYVILKEIKRSRTGRQDVTTNFFMLNDDLSKLNLNGSDKKNTILTKIQGVIGSFDNFVSHNLLATRMNGSIINMTPAVRIKHFLYIIDIDNYQIMHDIANNERKKIDIQITENKAKLREINAWINGLKDSKLESDEDIILAQKELDELELINSNLLFDEEICKRELYDINSLNTELIDLQKELVIPYIPLTNDEQIRLTELNKMNISSNITSILNSEKFIDKDIIKENEDFIILEKQYNEKSINLTNIKKLIDKSINITHIDIDNITKIVNEYKNTFISPITSDELIKLTKLKSNPKITTNKDDLLMEINQLSALTQEDIIFDISEFSLLSSKLFDINSNINAIKDKPMIESNIIMDEEQLYKEYTRFLQFKNYKPIIYENIYFISEDLILSEDQYIANKNEIDKLTLLFDQKITIFNSSKLKTYDEISIMFKEIKPLFMESKFDKIIDFTLYEKLLDEIKESKEINLIKEFKLCKKMGQTVMVPYDLYEKICIIIDDTDIKDKQKLLSNIKKDIDKKAEYEEIIEKNKEITKYNNTLLSNIMGYIQYRKGYLCTQNIISDKNNYNKYKAAEKAYNDAICINRYIQFTKLNKEKGILTLKLDKLNILIAKDKAKKDNIQKHKILQKLYNDIIEFEQLSEKQSLENEYKLYLKYKQQISEYNEYKANVCLYKQIYSELNEIESNLKNKKQFISEFNEYIHMEKSVKLTKERDILQLRDLYNKKQLRLNWIIQYIKEYENIKRNKDNKQLKKDNDNKINNLKFRIVKQKKINDDIISKNEVYKKINEENELLILRNTLLTKYVELVRHDKIPLKILRKYLDIFNINVNKIFSKHTKYTFQCIYEADKILMTINTKDGLILDAERLSGYESIIMQLAINNGILSIGKIPKCGMLVIDESFDCIDKDRFVIKLPEILEIIKMNYYSVLLISHRDVPNYLLDKKIKIAFNGEYSNIV